MIWGRADTTPLRRRRHRPVLVAVVVGVASCWIFSTPAGAHAVLTSSAPQDGSRLGAAPAEVRVTFSEPVSLALGGLVVVDALGQRVDTGDLTEHQGSEAVGVRLRQGLPDGTYIASYRVVSDDGHPISGAITFGIGVAPARTGVPDTADRVSEWLGWASRWLTYIGVFTACGVAFFVWFFHDGGPERRRLKQLGWATALVAFAGLLGQLFAHASLATGRGIGALLDRSLWGPVATAQLRASVATLTIGVAGALCALGTRRPRVGQTLALYSLFLASVGFAIWGHSIEGPRTGLQIAADAVHAFAGAVWFGGLIALVVTVVSRRPPRLETNPLRRNSTAICSPSTAHRKPVSGVAARFSLGALIATAALVLSGAILSWREVEVPSSLWSSSYGLTLLGKLAIGVVVLLTAWMVRRRLLPALLDVSPSSRDGDAIRSTSRIAAALRTEVVGLTVVLAVTAVLVNLVPARTDGATRTAESLAATPVDVTVPFGPALVNVTATPGRTGSNEIHVAFLDTSGRPADLAQSIEVVLELPEAGVGPLTAKAAPSGTGHFVITSQLLGAPGTWQVTVVARMTEFDQERVALEMTISP